MTVGVVGDSGGDPSWVVIGQAGGVGQSTPLIGLCVGVGEELLLTQPDDELQ